MVKTSVAAILICIQVTLVLCGDDYGSLFDSKEEPTTAFDELVRTTTVRTTRRSKTTTKKISRTTTPAPYVVRRKEDNDRDLDQTSVSAAPPSVQEERAIWEHGQLCEINKKCVSSYLCNKEGSIVFDGSFLIDERLDLGSEVEKPECPSMKVCCEKYKSLGKKQQPCSSFSAPSQCGIRNSQGLGGVAKSIQGKIDYAQYAEFPWMVAVMNETSLYGGGSLIHPKVVITAAHIIAGVDNKNMRVRGGEYNTQSTDEICPHIERKVKNILVHEQFTRVNLRNNLALLVLTEAFKMTATINTICLPHLDQSFENAVCVSAGWGKSNFEAKDRYQAFMKKVKLPVVPSEKCEEMLRRTRLGDDFVLHDKFLCAGGEKDIDVCTGDGGSPLMCPSSANPDVYVLAAVVAGGIGCGEKDVPGFYTDVAKKRGWIDSKMEILDIVIDDIEPRRN